MEDNRVTRIADRIRALRIKYFGPRGKSAFAKAIGIPQTTYLNYEEGRRLPPIDVIIKIAELTGCSIEWLITGKRGQKVVEDSELSGIIRRLTSIIEADSKARNAVIALLDLLEEKEGSKQASSQEKQAEKIGSDSEQKEYPRRYLLCPIVGRSAAGLPAIWLDKDDIVYQSLEDLLDIEEEDILSKAMIDVKGIAAEGHKEGTIGCAQIIELAEPLDLYGLGFDAVAVVDLPHGKVGRLLAFKIMGDSMEPLLSDGDIVIADLDKHPRSG